MAGRAEKRLAILLNSCNAGNILDAARSDNTALIEDYFLSDQVEEDCSSLIPKMRWRMCTLKTCVTSKLRKKMVLSKKLWFTSKVQRDAVMKWTAMVLQQKYVGKLNSDLATASRSKLWHCWMVIQDGNALTSFPQRSVWR